MACTYFHISSPSDELSSVTSDLIKTQERIETLKRSIPECKPYHVKLTSDVTQYEGEMKRIASERENVAGEIRDAVTLENR